MESFHSVAIVGAGLSGLYAAHLLKDQFPDVVLLEAQNRVGGRIKQVGGQGLVSDQDVDDEVDKVHDLFGDCGDEPHPPPGQDRSALEWMAAKGCTPRQVAVAAACYANDFGCSLRQLGVREMIEENRNWDSGETYLLMDRSMGHVITHLARGANVKTNWAVSSISYGTGSGADAGVTIRAADGRVVRCRAVLVTVPVPILQQGVISFSPALPAAKAAALSRVRMGNVVKVLLAFSRRFWPETMYDVVCPGAFAPEFWMLTYPTTDAAAGTPHCVVGFIAGERADEVSAMGPEAAQRRFLDQLDEIFGTPGEPRPASSSVVKAQVVDWSKEPFVRGAYTYPTLGAELGDRTLLAAPVAGQLFFAGEATNEAVNPCIQGAMQTAERAAAQITAALAAAPRSKL